VAEDEVPRRPPTSIEEAAERDDDLWQLKLTRKVIARKLDDPNCPSRDMASLSIRLMQLGKEIAVLEQRKAEEGTDAANVADEAFDASAV
jgi:hypothetical protein